jgi:16S rRNA (uracil1498-N3)-methyltransferase
MLHCLVPSLERPEEAMVLRDAAAHHLGGVLRARPGERVLLLDGQGRQLEAMVAEATRREVRLEACGSVRTLPRIGPSVTLFQCIAKASHMEWLVEKAIELGADELVPVVSRNCVVRPTIGERVARWDRIADAALEQCGAAWRTELATAHSWSQALDRIRAFNGSVIACALPPGTPPLRDVLAAPGALTGRYALVVGPEGDFADTELDDLQAAGARFAGLGPTVLRTDTATTAALACLRLLG